MGLSQALNTAMSGLRATQASLALVSSNVANAETPGYVKKTLNQVTGLTGDFGSSVLINGVNREARSAYLQSQMRTETSGASYADVRSNYLANLQTVYGNPDDSGTIENAFNNLTTAVQGLSTSPDSQSARIGVVNAAQSMAQQLNATTARHPEPARQCRDRHQQFRQRRQQCDDADRDHQQPAAEQRPDRCFDRGAARSARPVYRSAVAADGHPRRHQRPQPGDGVHQFRRAAGRHRGGEAVLQSAGHGDAEHAVQSRSDQEQCRHHHHQLPARRQLRPGRDQRRSAPARSPPISNCATTRWCRRRPRSTSSRRPMSSALSDKTTAGAAAPRRALPQAGFDLDLAGLQSGNVIHVTYKDNTTGATHNLSIVRVDDPSVLPLSNTATLDPNDEVLGVDFSGGMASVVSQLNAALGASANLQFSNPSGSTLRVLDDGAPNRSDVTAASVTTTMSSLTSGNARAAAVHRRRHALYRRDHRQRLAADRSCRAHQRQHRAARRSLAHHRLFDQPADGGRRHHARPISSSTQLIDRRPSAIRRRPASAPPARRSPARC